MGKEEELAQQQTEQPGSHLDVASPASPVEDEDKKKQHEKAAKLARAKAAKLVVLFVVPFVDESKAEKDALCKSKKLAEKVQKWCSVSGAKCAILPSPDALVVALARFANGVAGRTVTGKWLEQPSHLGKPSRSNTWAGPTLEPHSP